MTSKISFSKLVWDEIKKNTWLLAVQLLVFGMMIPLRVLVVLAGGGSYSAADAQKLELFCSHVGFGHLENLVVILAAGVLCALCAFGYVHSSVKLDFFHSLPLKRERLFAAKYLGSTATFGIAYLGSQLLALLVGAAFGAVNKSAALEVIVASLQGLICFLGSYSTALLAVLLTGKWLTTVFALGVLGLYLPLLAVLAADLRSIFLSAALPGLWGTSRSELLLYTSPWAMCVFQKGSKTMGMTGAWPDWKMMCLTAATAVVLTALDGALYRIRKTEAADSAVAFSRIEGAVKILLAIPAAILAAFVAHSLLHRVVWEALFLAGFGVIGCMTMEFIYRWDIRQIFQRKRHMAVTIGVAALVFFSFRFDVLGYNTYLPDEEELVSMAARDQWVRISYESEVGQGENYGHTLQRILDHLETEEISLLYPLAENGIANQKAHSARETTQVFFKYRTKDGKEIYRCYWVDTEQYQEVMNEMLKKREYRKKYYPILTWDKTRTEHMTVWCYSMEELFSDYDKGDMMEISSRNAEELLEAYRKDLEEVDFKEIWECEQNLTFSAYQMEEYYPMGRKMEHTMEVLEKVWTEEKQKERK